MTAVLVIAGTASGVGKTSVTLALAAAYARRGLVVQTAKVGPDFLDPKHLMLATGRDCINLDSYMMGRHYVHKLARKSAANADLLLVEGVMGLFDGVDPTSNLGSTAEMAQLLDANILLVADARAQARSFAATVFGFSQFDRSINIAGVIANHVGSPHHAELLAKALESAGLPPLIAHLEKGALPSLPSRHLGLVSPNGRQAIDALAAAAEACLPLDRILRLGKPFSTLLPGQDPPISRKNLRLAVASDEAFSFVYADFRQTLLEQGVEWIPCSPLRDSQIPEAANALFLPGGYPEEYADQIAENRPFLESLKHFSAKRPVYAECGGLMLLGDRLLDRQDRSYRMAGILPGQLRLGTKAARLGYAEVTLTANSLWGNAGDRCRGHEFHYSSLELDELRAQNWNRVYQVTYGRGGTQFEGYQRDQVLASYVHLHLPSRPEQLAHFLRRLAA